MLMGNACMYVQYPRLALPSNISRYHCGNVIEVSILNLITVTNFTIMNPFQVHSFLKWLMWDIWYIYAINSLGVPVGAFIYICGKWFYSPLWMLCKCTFALLCLLTINTLSSTITKGTGNLWATSSLSFCHPDVLRAWRLNSVTFSFFQSLTPFSVIFVHSGASCLRFCQQHLLLLTLLRLWPVSLKNMDCREGRSEIPGRRRRILKKQADLKVGHFALYCSNCVNIHSKPN